MNYGYARVCFPDNEGLQAQKAKLIPYVKNEANIFCDVGSGCSFDRAGYLELKRSLKENDIVYVTEVSRLSRNRFALEKEYIDLMAMKVEIIFLDEIHLMEDFYGRE